MRESGVVGATIGTKSSSLRRQRRAASSRLLRAEGRPPASRRARSLRSRRKLLLAEREDRVVVAHHDQRDVARLAQLGARCRARRHRGAGAQRSLARPLNHRAVRSRVAERHADLDHIRAGVGCGLQQQQRGVEVGIARADVDRESGALARCAPARKQQRCGSSLAPFAGSSQRIFLVEDLEHGLQILVAAAGQAHDHVGLGIELALEPLEICDGVAALERGYDALAAGTAT